VGPVQFIIDGAAHKTSIIISSSSTIIIAHVTVVSRIGTIYIAFPLSSPLPFPLLMMHCMHFACPLLPLLPLLPVVMLYRSYRVFVSPVSSLNRSSTGPLPRRRRPPTSCVLPLHPLLGTLLLLLGTLLLSLLLPQRQKCSLNHRLNLSLGHIHSLFASTVSITIGDVASPF
jgi:hypothetical protein